MLMYVPFFKENYDDVLSQHTKKIKKIKIIMIFVDKKFQTKNISLSPQVQQYMTAKLDVSYNKKTQ